MTSAGSRSSSAEPSGPCSEATASWTTHGPCARHVTYTHVYLYSLCHVVHNTCGPCDQCVHIRGWYSCACGLRMLYKHPCFEIHPLLTCVCHLYVCVRAFQTHIATNMQITTHNMYVHLHLHQQEALTISELYHALGT